MCVCLIKNVNNGMCVSYNKKNVRIDVSYNKRFKI